MVVSDLDPAAARDEPLRLIFQHGKVGSQTLETSLRESAPDLPIERHHYLTPNAVRELEVAASGADAAVAQSVRAQAEAASRARDAVARASSVIILTGYREPLDQAISGYFQNIDLFCPTLTWSLATEATDTKAAMDTFHADFAGMLERRRQGRAATSLRDHLIDLKLGGIHRWFATEFKDFLGARLGDFAVETTDVCSFSFGKFTLVFYRYETLRDRILDVMESAAPGRKIAVKNVNLGDEKPWGGVYSRFRSDFRASMDMYRYYYSDAEWGPYASRLYTAKARPYALAGDPARASSGRDGA